MLGFLFLYVPYIFVKQTKSIILVNILNPLKAFIVRQIVNQVIMVKIVIKFADVKIIHRVIPTLDDVFARPAGPEKIALCPASTVSMAMDAKRNVPLLCMATRAVII